MVTLGSTALPGGLLYAQDSGRSEQKTRKTPAMTEKVYTKLTEAQELIEAKQINQGLAKLGELRAMKNLNSYELAQMWNYYAYTYFTMERYKDAIKAYENVLAQPELPEALETGTMYTLAQLYFTIEDYRRAVQIIEKWMTVVPEPSEQAYMLLGQGYYQLEEYKKALEPLKTAMKLVKSRGQIPKENLYLLLRVNYYELNDYKSMAAVVKEMLPHYPKPEYWLTLAGAYSELGKQKEQMSIMELLYESGQLTRGNQVLNLANLYLLYEVPYKAAVVLEKGIKDGIIEPKINNLRLLSQAWFQAREDEKSIPPLKRAAEKSKDGDLDVRLAQSYINLDRWKEAVAALQTALKKGGIKRRDTANVMLGMSLFELKKYESAKKAFRLARGDRRSSKTAAQWIAYIESEQARRAALKDGLKPREEVEKAPETSS